MIQSTSCTDPKHFLKNLRTINQQAKVDPEIIDLIEAYAKLRMKDNKNVTFYPETVDHVELNDLLKKNRHLDHRVLYFLCKYFKIVEGRGLTCLINKVHLAYKLNTSMAQLHEFSVNTSHHYHYFEINKSNGTKRQILAPKPQLKMIQRSILEQILEKIGLNSHAEGFRKNRSILTNAQRHIGKKMVIKMDIENFFPSITFKRVLGMFTALGYPRQVSLLLTRLITHQDQLPTGAPTSPAISNIVCTKLDKRLSSLGRKLNFDYSRYADDMTFSSNEKRIIRLIPFFKNIIRDEGFEMNASKLKILRDGGQQKVAGIVVNQKANIERAEIKKIRAILYNCRHKIMHREVEKWARQEKGVRSNEAYSVAQFKSSIQGKINYIKMVNPKAGKKLEAQLEELVKTV